MVVKHCWWGEISYLERSWPVSFTALVGEYGIWLGTSWDQHSLEGIDTLWSREIIIVRQREWPNSILLTESPVTGTFSHEATSIQNPSKSVSPYSPLISVFTMSSESESFTILQRTLPSPVVLNCCQNGATAYVQYDTGNGSGPPSLASLGSPNVIRPLVPTWKHNKKP